MEKKINWNKILLWGVFFVFILFSIYLVFKIKMGVSPDSSYHLEVSQAYSTTVFRPENTPDTYQWRDITRISYLFFWINGRILNINNGVLDEVILLRIVNLIYSLGTLFVTYLLSKEIFKNRGVRILPVFFLSSTLMFVFLSASINYDNLANLLSVLSILFFVKFVKSKVDIKYLLLMILFLCLGALTKFTVLPLALILVLLTIIDIFKKKKYLKNIKIGKEYFLLLPILLFGFLNIELYGINIIKYGGLEPDCNKILTHEQCLQNGVYFRDNVTFKSTQIDGLKGYIRLLTTGERIGPIRYFLKWLPNFTMKIYGIFADQSLFMPEPFWYLFISFFLLATVLGVINFKKWDRVERYLIVISLFYFVILFFFQNYSMYLRFNHYYLALQGRYIFPVISILYILFAKSLLFIKRKWLRNLILIVYILLLIYSCIPFFFFEVPSWWLSGI